MSCLNLKLLLFLVVIGAAIFIVGLILGLAVFPNIIEEQIDLSVKLQTGTKQWDRFEELPFPLTFKVYLFNILNPYDIINGEKPRVEEVGPYVYKQYRKKVNLDISDYSTLSYEQYQYYEFDHVASFPYKEDDVITMLNVPLNGLFQIAEKDMPYLLRSVNTGWPKVFGDTDTLFHQVTVKDYLFNGYNFCIDDTLTTPQSKAICRNIKNKLTKTMKVLKNSIAFSFFDYKNNNNDGNYQINTGLDEIKNLGNIIQWEYQNYTKFWKEGSECNKVKGTDSSIFPPHNDINTIFDVFNTDICRTVQLEFHKKINYKSISGFRNQILRNTLNTGIHTPENSCYCTRQTRDLFGEDACHPNGFNDLYNCQGAPILLSFPHFLWASDDYSQTVYGLKPSEEKHVTYLDYEPDTGTPLRGVKRVQFNMIIRPIEKIVITQNVQPAVIPLIWVEEGVELPDHLVDELNNEYFNKVTISVAVQWTLVAIGILFVIGAVTFYFMKRRKQSN